MRNRKAIKKIRKLMLDLEVEEESAWPTPSTSAKVLAILDKMDTDQTYDTRVTPYTRFKVPAMASCTTAGFKQAAILSADVYDADREWSISSGGVRLHIQVTRGHKVKSYDVEWSDGVWELKRSGKNDDAK